MPYLSLSIYIYEYLSLSISISLSLYMYIHIFEAMSNTLSSVRLSIRNVLCLSNATCPIRHH